MTCVKQVTATEGVIEPDWSQLHWIVSAPGYQNHAAQTLNGIALLLGPPPVQPAQDVGTQDNLDATYAPNGDVSFIVEGSFAYNGPAANCRAIIEIFSGPPVSPDHIIRFRVSNDTFFLTPAIDVHDKPIGITNIDFTVTAGGGHLFVDWSFGTVAIGAPAYHFKVTFVNL